jgi:hypothetical protein
MQQTEHKTLDELSRRLEQSLLRDFGYLVGGSALWHALGYPTPTAFQRAQDRGILDDLPLFKISRRRGVFCMAEDLAYYLAKARFGQLEMQIKNSS